MKIDTRLWVNHVRRTEVLLLRGGFEVKQELGEGWIDEESKVPMGTTGE